MNTFEFRSGRYPRLDIYIVSGLAAAALAGCGSTNKVTEKSHFADCTLEQIQGKTPVSLERPTIDNRNDVEKIKQMIRRYPTVLIDTAEHLKASGDSADLGLFGLQDNDHRTPHFNSLGGADGIDSVGDILCQSLPLGSSDEERGKLVYYDHDGEALLAKTEASLKQLQK